MRSYYYALTFALSWSLIVTLLLCLPGTEFPTVTWLNRIWFDKWVHIVLFFLLVIFWCRLIRRNEEPKKLRNKFLWISIFSLFYGMLMEVVQHYFIPFRSFDFGDIIADAVGCGGGFWCATYWYIKK